MNDAAIVKVESKGDPEDRTESASPGRRSSETVASTKVVIAGTFTADLLHEPLVYWMHALEIVAEVELAPYAQVLQELLNPQSVSAQNQTGFNVLLIRPEDWIRDRSGETLQAHVEHLNAVTDEFVSALSALHKRTAAAVLMLLCPPSSELPSDRRTLLSEIEARLRGKLAAIRGVYCSTHEDVVRLYPVESHEDARADRIGHIPYTPEYFTAIASLIARQITARVKSQFKVIALDCDNTLWQGICGEDGTSGIELTAAHLELQRLLVEQHDAGVLLCLCSKNDENDVRSVFASHPEMPLREEHLISSRVNWQPKSANLGSLADELELSLDSFIFIDDSAIECAEVRAHCPSVLTLQLPDTAMGIRHFLAHVWAFDRVDVTHEARQRTAQYKQNSARRMALAESADLGNFLASLDLQVDVGPMQPEQLARVAELTQRTNQFNFTTTRRTASDIAARCSSGELQALVVHVRDRFGDYGLVGVVLFRLAEHGVEVDTFLLSCRVLGRGVEHRVFQALAKIVRAYGLQEIVLRYRATPRSAPASAFLDEHFAQFRMPTPVAGSANESTFTVPVDYAAEVNVASSKGVAPSEVARSNAATAPGQSGVNTAWHETAYRLARVADVIEAMRRPARASSTGDIRTVPASTELEAALAAIWTDVLSLNEVSVVADFLDVGGDSLAAVQVLSRVGSVLGLELSIGEFFERPTIQAVARRLSDAQALSDPIRRRIEQGTAPLSSAQRRVWFIDRLEGGSAAYHIPLAIRVRGSLDVDALHRALASLLKRHEALRTSIPVIAGQPQQAIAAESAFPLRLFALHADDTDARSLMLSEHLHEEFAAPFDLGVAPLIRGRLLHLAEDEHLLLLAMHHTVSDGSSASIVFRDLCALYAGRQEQLPSLPVQYADYAIWQRERLRRAEIQGHLEFWKQHLQGAPALLDLPTDRARPVVQTYRGATTQFRIEAALTKQLREVARRHGMTLVMVLHAAWTVVLARLSGQTDIVVGVPVANRQRMELEELIGFFVNTLAVRVRLDDDPQVPDLLERVKGVMRQAYSHQDTPFEQVVEALQPVRSLSYSPIFQVMLAAQRPLPAVVQLPDVSFAAEEVPLCTAQFDLLLSVSESADGISASLNYATDLFDSPTAERWLRYFNAALIGMAGGFQGTVSRLPLIDAEERRQTVDLFNETSAAYSQHALIHGLIEEQAVRTPGAVAVEFDGSSLTYAQLNAKANQLARHLRSSGIGADQLVGIYVERSIEMVVGLLAILKAGGAYVPIDPNYPADRVAYMVEDAAPKVLLTQRHLRGRLPQTTSEVILLESDWHAISTHGEDNLDPRELGLTSRNLAYVIYTSGSTGQPKGAMNEHRALINRLQWMQSAYRLDESDRVLQKTPFSFDVSVWEFFWTLMCGAQLVVAQPQGHQDPEYLREVIETRGVTTLHFVPSMLQAFLDGHRAGRCPSIRHVVCSGEELPASLQRKFFECFPRAKLSNLYGPTEAAVDVTAWECLAGNGSARVPIGRPIANTHIYVLDPHGEPVPLGVAGEIYIGGVQVGRGYLNRPELTRERFVRDPFSADAQARLYKTGDVGRWRADGTLEYLGRNDHQVKIRGFRIELGEIEAQLSKHRQVKEVAVLAREDVPGEKRLVAYIVAAEAAEVPRIEGLREHLQEVLPQYMVPSAFVMLEQMPLTPNGKLDRKALPAPDQGAYASKHYQAPLGEVEEILAGIWQTLLRVERVGRNDNFFELGGHSLLIVQMMERLRRVGLSAELRKVFESPTLRDLAGAISRGVVDDYEVPANLIPAQCTAITPQMLPLIELQAEHIEQIERCIPGGAANIEDIYPLAPLQEGILFHHLLEQSGSDTYVVPTVLSVASRARAQELIAALQEIVDRHAVLRTAIVWEGLPRAVQVVQRRARLSVEEVSLDPGRGAAGQVREWLEPQHQQMDLRCAPLMRVRVAADPHGEQCYVLLQSHHIVGDNTSQEIVFAELVAKLEHREHAQEQLVSYRNHVARVLAYAVKHDAEAFFRSKLGDVDEPTAPYGLLEVHGDGAQLEEAHEVLESTLAQRTRAQARRLGISAATLFHAAWALVVARTSGRDDVVFGSVLLGRMQGVAGSERALGMFINTLPLRLRLEGVSAAQLVESTQRELVELFTHEQASLALAQRCSGIVGSAPLFTSLFNYRRGLTSAGSQWSGVSGVQVLAMQDRTNYPITVSVDDYAEGFSLTLQTHWRIDARRMVGYLRTVVESLVAALECSPEKPATLLEIVPQRERQEIVEQFNATRAEYPHEQLAHELFEEQVRRTPDAVAVIYEDQSLSYAELNRRANRLARYLRAQGVQPAEYIPVLMPRSLRMVVAQLAVLKSGAVYVPMDPELPAERRLFMIGDCGARRVLASASLPVELQAAAVQWIDLPAAEADIDAQRSEDLQLRLDFAPAAYVMYTSGSTGMPKGVIVPHHAINRLVINNGYARITSEDCLAHYSNPTFDASTFEIWGALLNGARVVVVPQSTVLDGRLFAEALDRHGVSMLYMSVGLFNQYTEQLARALPGLRYLMVGGDTLDPRAIKRVLKSSPPEQFLNVYGPTECTTFSTSYRIESVEEDTKDLPIGRPIANAQVYILDRGLQVVPVGVTGEIYIAGAGVARGYLNRAQLTAERFVADPFSGDPQARMYKTGDLGRWRADGVIEFLGRNDQQVKIRGFRIELGEIEAQLSRHEQVQEAVVLARQDVPGEKRLVAYVIAKEPLRPPNAEGLRGHLKGVLPEYMIPSAYVVLEQLPLTTNGKLDRRALPAPELQAYASGQYEAPQGEIEEILAGIWQSLLQVARVGRNDNFFELGGHSLLIVQMMERLRRVGLSAEVRRVFESATLAELAAALSRETQEEHTVPPNLIAEGCTAITPEMLPLVELQARHIERIVQWVPGGAANVQDIYPLAPLQEGILFHHLLNEAGGDTYVVPTLLSVSSRERVAELMAALQGVIDRHEVLRTAVLWEELPRPVQVVHRRASLRVAEVSLQADRDADEQVREWLAPQLQRMDLTQAPLMQLRVAADPHGAGYFVLLQMHHLSIDHVTAEVVTAEVVRSLEGRALQPTDFVPYRNHVAQALAYARTHEAERFFREKLGDIDEPTAPFGLLDVHGDGTPVEELYEEFAAELSQRARSQARRLSVSAATLFHAAWGLVVAHTSGREDVVFGSVLLGRMQGGAGHMLGMFINTLPLRLNLADSSARELVERTQRQLVELLNHEQASLAVAQRCSRISGSTPLFTTLLNYRHSAPSRESQWSSATGVSVLGSQDRTNYPITVSIDDFGEKFSQKVQTDSRIDARRIAGYMRQALESLVEALERAPQSKALSLSILPEAERSVLLGFSGLSAADYSTGKLLHELFEEQAQRTPRAVAVVYEGRSLTYAELNAQANQLARYLRDRGVGPDGLVAICVERSLELVIGVLGILKSGGAYVPLDPNYPRDRLQHMLEDSAPRAVLVQERVRALLPPIATEVIALDTSWNEIAGLSQENLSRAVTRQAAQHLAYVIYTSGSTGKPKGVMVEHRNVTRLLSATAQWFSFDERDVWTLFHSFAFDFSVWELWGALLYGGRLVVVPYLTSRSPGDFYRLVCAEGVTVLNQTPSAFSQLSDAQAGRPELAHALRVVIFGGEALELHTLRPWVKRNGVDKPQLVNMYGITETTVHVTYRVLREQEIESERSSIIGTPIADLQVHLLDTHQQLVPIGVVGEMYVGGAGVARGYLHRPQLTAERFIENPFGDRQGQHSRLYRSGDLARRRADGELEYLGRNDHQVKIRGFRIELGEIEAQLARLGNVKEVSVIAREDTPGEKQLVAYVVAQDAAALNVDDIRAHLKAGLPEYMVPSACVMLERLPLTANGKLDRKALPAPDISAHTSRAYEAPQGEVEEILAALWQELLHLERVGRRDNFFELGGHSLHGIRMMTKIAQIWTLRLPVVAIFQYPSVLELAGVIESLRTKHVEVSDIAGPEYEQGVIFTIDAEIRESIP